MEIKLWKKPKNPIIIDGFPGFGLVSTIATEFLIDHLDIEMIGKVIINEGPAVVAIHGDKVVEPLGIFYNKKHNIIIIHAVSPSTGKEWDLADVINKLANDLNAKEIISLEGVGSSATKPDTERTFYFTKDIKKKKSFEKIGIKPLKEGIIMGVTGALLLKVEKIPMSCIFAETHTDLPDSKAAARVIKNLDQYLGLKIDYKPLYAQAEKFEEKLKGILEKGKEVQELSEMKKLNYVG
ncbi:MAG: proteasome assembly chaperone family protein [Nanoarchaeota archaeon]|nr:proteasome assembly chaperone family protein [Nanoarchaeota archaeon]